MVCSNLYDSELLESCRISNNVLRLPDLKRMLERDQLRTLRPGERCVQWLELLYGQVCIALGEFEAARQLLNDGFAISEQTFGTNDVLTLEFQTTLAEVCIARGETELAISYLSPAVMTEKPGRSDLCAITARTLKARALTIAGSLDEAEPLLRKCLNEAVPIIGDDHLMIWRVRYAIIIVKFLQKDYATAEKYLRALRDLIIEGKGPEHLDVLYMTLDLASLKLQMSESEEAGQICQALLLQQQKRDKDSDDLIKLTKVLLWACHLQSGRTDSESDLRKDLLETLQNGSMPNPQLARRWEWAAWYTAQFGAVDVASALKKHSDKAMELAFGIEYVQAMEKKEASPEDSDKEASPEDSNKGASPEDSNKGASPEDSNKE